MRNLETLLYLSLYIQMVFIICSASCHFDLPLQSFFVIDYITTVIHIVVTWMMDFYDALYVHERSADISSGAELWG